jgi:NADH-quinone oxidoreductase subunit N
MVTLAYARPYAAEPRDAQGRVLHAVLFSLLGICVMSRPTTSWSSTSAWRMMSLSLYALVALRRDHAQPPRRR